MNKKLQILGLACLMLTLVGVTGCESDPYSPEAVRKNLMPEMQSLARTKEQWKNVRARTFNTNSRQMYEDWNAIMLFDRPVWMSIYPVP